MPIISLVLILINLSQMSTKKDQWTNGIEFEKINSLLNIIKTNQFKKLKLTNKVYQPIFFRLVFILIDLLQMATKKDQWTNGIEFEKINNLLNKFCLCNLNVKIIAEVKSTHKKTSITIYEVDLGNINL